MANLLTLTLLLAVGPSCRAARVPAFLSLRGGKGDGRHADGEPKKSFLTAAKPSLPSLKLDKVVDTALAGIGVAGTFALMGALEPLLGVKLFVPPMMASGLIFFSPATPPSPKGFISGTIGCATASAALLSLLTGVVSPVTAQGCAAGALLVWYKATGCIFPPAAVLCVLMAGVPAGTNVAQWVAAPWVAGHACIYASALSVSAARSGARRAINRQRLKTMTKMSTADLKDLFKRFDTSKDGSLDATELKVALRVAVGADFSLGECQALIERVDVDGTNSLDFAEFSNIVDAQAK